MFLKEKRKTSDVYLSQPGYKFLMDFEIFLREYQSKDHHKPCGQNTIMKHIERLRKIVKLAIKNEWLEKDPFVKFKPTFIKNSQEFLNVEEFTKIEDKVLRIERLRQEGIFLFSVAIKALPILMFTICKKHFIGD